MQLCARSRRGAVYQNRLYSQSCSQSDDLCAIPLCKVLLRFL
jgi:hypothetical protein